MCSLKRLPLRLAPQGELASGVVGNDVFSAEDQSPPPARPEDLLRDGESAPRRHETHLKP